MVCGCLGGLSGLGGVGRFRESLRGFERVWEGWRGFGRVWDGLGGFREVGRVWEGWAKVVILLRAVHIFLQLNSKFNSTVNNFRTKLVDLLVFFKHFQK